jgi:hypothetical protein
VIGQRARDRAAHPVFDKSARDDGTFSRGDFDYNQDADIYVYPVGKVLASTGTLVNDRATLLYRASKYDCDACELTRRWDWVRVYDKVDCNQGRPPIDLFMQSWRPRSRRRFPFWGRAWRPSCRSIRVRRGARAAPSHWFRGTPPSRNCIQA